MNKNLVHAIVEKLPTFITFTIMLEFNLKQNKVLMIYYKNEFKIGGY